MRKQLMFLAVAAAAGLLLFAGRNANAQTYNFDADASLKSGGGTVGGASGSYHVTMTYDGIVSSGVDAGDQDWHVVITGNNDGNPPSGNPPKHAVDQITLGFFNPTALDGFDQSEDANGGTNSGGAFTGHSWNTAINGDTTAFQAPKAVYGLAPYGANSFSGDVFIDPGHVTGFHVVMQDGGQQWNADFTVAPEPAALALLLPGMAPIGLVLFRRRRNRA